MVRSTKDCRASKGGGIPPGNGQNVAGFRRPETDKTSFWGFKSENNGAKSEFAPLLAILVAKIGKKMAQNRVFRAIQKSRQDCRVIQLLDGRYFFRDVEALERGPKPYQVPHSFIHYDTLDDETVVYAKGRLGRAVEPYDHKVFGPGFLVYAVRYDHETSNWHYTQKRPRKRR